MYAVEIYETGDFPLPDEPDEVETHDNLGVALDAAWVAAVERYDPDELQTQTDDELGENAVRVFEPGQPGNIVLRHTD